MKSRIAAAVTALLVSGAAQAGLVNGGFELPGFGPNTVNFPTAVQVPGWETTATDQRIEIWTTAFNGVSAYQGNQFAELNANQVSTLYQDVTGIANGALVGYQFAHRGRAGVDTMRFEVRDLSNNSILFQRTVATGNNAWSFYSGSGIQATGNTLRFAFVSVAAAGGPTVGNFLDAADFGVGVPEPGVLALAAMGLLALGLNRRRNA